MKNQASTATPAFNSVATGTTAKLSATARAKWSINFEVPKPAAMSTDRMQARAELVRNAANCGGY
jgi:hypothetical protein